MRSARDTGRSILLACFCGLRWGELAGLQRADIDCDRRTIRIARQLCEVAGRQPFLAPPKSDAGKRTVSMPSLIVADISSHLDTFTQPEADALVFTSPHGMPLRHANFRRRIWLPALAATGSTFTCTTCAIPATSSSPRQAPTLVS